MANGVWTNNWQSVINTMLMNTSKPGMNSIVLANGTAWAESNDNILMWSPMTYYANYPYSSGIGNSYRNGPIIRVGKSGTTPTAADYALGDEVTAGYSGHECSYLSTINVDTIPDQANGTLTRIIRTTVQYALSGTITLREWGLFIPAGDSSFSTILIYHELLDSPVTLQSYQSATIELNLVLTLSDPL